ncbi:membrane protein [Gallibacterium salpingitidis]|uniref:Membrane protein n=1 Tax=Gallibacterium salpingitidis TaxID=505341 RepID=A0AB36E1E6_9PAST|nr:Fe-S-containing protein [Gallibacterium salpingitidis]OBX07703.1 membrane protein [Gallibacterium salpingitidis]OBX09503.1 membrane protein [Gallibacterium salpingitidis]
MNYYFVFLLQAVLPLAILLGCNWSRYRNVNIKNALWLTVIGFTLGIILSLNYPNNQQAKLILNSIILALLLLFYLLQFIHSNKLAYLFQFVFCIIAGIFWAKDPNVSAITNTDVINTDFILHLAAVISGLFFCIFITVWLNILLQQSQVLNKLAILRLVVLTFITTLLIIPILGEITLALMKLQVFELTKLRLSFVAKSSNITAYLNNITAILLLIIIACFSLKVYLPHKKAVVAESHPIEKRKKMVAMRNSRRTIIWGSAATILIIAAQLYWDKVASQPPKLSEATPVTLDHENNVHIPIDQVKDGKLHRFVWVASDGKAVRFFIINRSTKNISLAAVFDACILCGDQGYVMEGDQVVCVGCGVRMFIPSIGKPGGCNPVPIEGWQQTATDVVISRKSLEDGLNYFSTIVELEVTDPVNGKKLKNTTAEHKYSYEGKTYFFTSEQNLNLFRDNPENYLSNSKGTE